MDIRHEQVTLQCDSNYLRENLHVLTDGLRVLKRQYVALENQNIVLSSSNSALQDYFAKFKFDAKLEQENISKALEESQEDTLLADTMQELEGIEQIDNTAMVEDFDLSDDSLDDTLDDSVNASISPDDLSNL